MAITILPPAPAEPIVTRRTDDADYEIDIESDGDVDMDDGGPPAKRAKSRHLVTPGELVTSDSQWMR